MNKYEQIKKDLIESPKKWVITGVAGFIGSNILEELLDLNQQVLGIDNFSTGSKKNLSEVKAKCSNFDSNFTFHEIDICDYDSSIKVIKGNDYVLHQAALGSVPRSIKNPLKTNASNVTGFLNILDSAYNENIESFVYAASSSTYGDHPDLPKKEEIIGNPLSPYGLTKYINELYSDIYSRVFEYKAVGLRYFNVFGKRQDPEGAYAAVIPKWVASMIKHDEIHIYGDGETSRDFCYVENAVMMNILAAVSDNSKRSHIYNVAVGERTSLNDLFQKIKDILKDNGHEYNHEPIYKEFRKGDVRHSLADISKAESILGYSGYKSLNEGLKKAIPWYCKNLK